MCRALSSRHDVTILCAEYDPARASGQIAWKTYQGLPVVELVNNWDCDTFADSYRSPWMTDRIAQVLRAVQPDIVHVHNLLNLSFDLPDLAHRRGVPVVATLHDYALVCPSGGQRIHRAEEHVCRSIDPERCVRCFRESPFYSQMAFGRLAQIAPAPRVVKQAMVAVARKLRVVGAAAMAARAPIVSVTEDDINERLNAARRVFDAVDLFVAPSASIASEFTGLGMPAGKIRVSDYGFVPIARSRRQRSGPLRIGYVGTLVWHKGVHVLVEAVRALPVDSFELQIFGDQDVFPDYAARLRERAGSMPVRFLGGFDRDRTAEVYGQIDVLVVPSLWLENSPLVIHEAFMSGVPVVGANIGGIAGLVRDGVSGLLYEATSAVALRSALTRLIDEPGLLDRLATGLPAVKSIDEDAREWERTYDEVSGRPQRVAQVR